MNWQVVHLSTNHTPFDTRIFVKECSSLVSAGYQVAYVVPHHSDIESSGVRIYSVPIPKTRLRRLFFTAGQIYRRALRANADLYHFHDFDLIFVGLLLKLAGKKVIYDAHEDLPRQLMNKHWIKPVFRPSLAWLVGIVEQLGSRYFDGIVAATPTIAKRFPQQKTTIVRNFPLLSEFEIEHGPYVNRPLDVAYIGGITLVRGAKEIVQAMSLLDVHATLRLAGKFEPAALQSELVQLNGWSKVDYLGWQSRSQIAELLNHVRVGLVTLYPISNYVDALPVKLFEYMAAGVPVVASNFPLWKTIIEEAGCGLLVNPLNPAEIAEAIQWLLENPLEAQRMGEAGKAAISTRLNWLSESANLLKQYADVLDV